MVGLCGVRLVIGIDVGMMKRTNALNVLLELYAAKFGERLRVNVLYSDPNSGVPALGKNTSPKARLPEKLNVRELGR